MIEIVFPFQKDIFFLEGINTTIQKFTTLVISLIQKYKCSPCKNFLFQNIKFPFKNFLLKNTRVLQKILCSKIKGFPIQKFLIKKK